MHVDVLMVSLFFNAKPGQLMLHNSVILFFLIWRKNVLFCLTLVVLLCTKKKQLWFFYEKSNKTATKIWENLPVSALVLAVGVSKLPQSSIPGPTHQVSPKLENRAALKHYCHQLAGKRNGGGDEMMWINLNIVTGCGNTGHKKVTFWLYMNTFIYELLLHDTCTVRFAAVCWWHSVWASGGRASWVCSLFLKFLVMKLHENRVL